ncbi:SHOCT domain-containing protein [Candidatus Solincola tengchongensis]|uniref:SHOCT domain-containing protein n=1 Tax=Candidatus Solincola tengchongensis TaxID=2900693 RepID=UPI00257ABF9D|nr:SHOCT domain-containing protein [Candidatus Solincola tengchongensis]
MGLLAECWEGFAHWGTGGWIWMGIMMVAGLVLLAVLIYAAFRGLSHYTAVTGPGGAVRETPLDIARRRYAAGEISPEEFERLKADLGG